MTFNFSTNLADLPYGTFYQLSKYLDSDDFLQKLFNSHCSNSVYNLLPDEVERYKRMSNPGAHFLRQLGNRGETVKSFLTQLNVLSKIYGGVMNRPQLILKRKFCSVIWSKPEQVVVICNEKEQLKLQCKASGFPIPQYQWLEEDKPLVDANSSSLTIRRCPCTARNVFKCRVWNVIEEGYEWSSFYRMNGKIFQSELISNIVDLSRYVQDGSISNCSVCNKNNFKNICQLVKNLSTTDGKNSRVDSAEISGIANELESMTADAIASDKVALIISNRTYAPHMPNLITPHCDAESLADVLQKLNFKTVTLGDLRIDEMKFIVHEFKKFLGEDVYAVFYFVGHGFEANGQCFLLPIGAPADNYGPVNCLSMDWVMSVFKDCNPALNLILLDICRTFLPANSNDFAERFRRDVSKVNRNTVYGFATSGGVNAYEMRGEKNGVFMKYLKKRIGQRLTVLDMLNKVFRDIEKNKKVRDVQIPELRSNLTRPRSLLDPLIYEGHTNSYDHHTMHWRLMHKLPNPVHLMFVEKKLLVTVWFDFCGHFTNKVYVFSSVGKMPADDGGFGDLTKNDKPLDEQNEALTPVSYLAYLKFPPEFDASKPKLCTDDEEGYSLCYMLSHLQRSKGELRSVVEVCILKESNESDKSDYEKCSEFVASKDVTLGHVLITRLTSSVTPQCIE